MTSRKIENSSVKALATVVAVSVLGLTTTVNTTGTMYTPMTAIWKETPGYGIGTETLMPKIVKEKKVTFFEQAKELFGGKMRDFTKDEAKTYQESLKKIYQPTGANIFDLC
ncbi:MAG: hypothetical protein K2O03_07860 [Lachnospiraceae bacterium]|nr:hypothetical protein [Lachnospiraceae bacterium]